jgi:coenzyme F420-dependent glucose-6-phosphate dehydrogenase
MCSDHFHPWSERQGQSGFAWSWLGAALQATGPADGCRQRTRSALPPGDRRAGRCHAGGDVPRPLLAGGRQRPGPQRAHHRRRVAPQARPQPAAARERRGDARPVAGRDRHPPWRGRGGGRQAVHAPLAPPRLVGAAITAETAGWVAGWADALVTIAKPIDELRPVVEAFRAGGGEGKPMALQVQLAYAASDDEALRAAHEQWGTNILDSPVLATLRMPADFEAAATFVRPDDLVGPVLVSADPALVRGPARRVPRARLLRALPARRAPRPGTLRARLRRARPARAAVTAHASPDAARGEGTGSTSDGQGSTSVGRVPRARCTR